MSRCAGSRMPPTAITKQENGRPERGTCQVCGREYALNARTALVMPPTIRRHSAVPDEQEKKP